MKITNEKLKELLAKCKFDYMSDTEWMLDYTDSKYTLCCGKGENGVNYIEECLIKVKGNWIEIELSDKQVEMIYKEIDTYEPLEEEKFEEIDDMYHYFGVKRSDFF